MVIHFQTFLKQFGFFSRESSEFNLEIEIIILKISQRPSLIFCRKFMKTLILVCQIPFYKHFRFCLLLVSIEVWNQDSETILVQVFSRWNCFISTTQHKRIFYCKLLLNFVVQFRAVRRTSNRVI